MFVKIVYFITLRKFSYLFEYIPEHVERLPKKKSKFESGMMTPNPDTLFSSAKQTKSPITNLSSVFFLQNMMIFLHVSVSNLVHGILACDQIFQSPQLCLSDSKRSNFSCVARRQTKRQRLFCLIKAHRGSGAWFPNQECWWKLGLGGRVLNTCVGKLVRKKGTC